MLARVCSFAVVLLAVGIPAPCFAQEAATQAPPPVIAAIDEAMQEFVDQHVASGVVTLVAHKGKIVHLGAVGMSDIDAQQPMKIWSRFAIASMTKPITATALMILQDEGKLDIDDPIGKYLPAFADVKLSDGNAPSRALTIRDAITHTSGIAGNQVFQGSLANHVDDLATKPLAFEPGAKWQYSPGMSVAGRIIEVVSGQPYDTFLQERIFTPLEMKNTTFYLDEKQQRSLAKIYMPGEENQSLVVADNHISDFNRANGPNPSGGLVSTARDLFRFYQMVLNGGQFRKQRIVSTDAVQQMTARQTGELETGFTPGNCWGLGWCVVRQPQGVTENLSEGAFGHGGAFGTQGWVDPKTNTVYVLLIQRTKMGNSDGSDIRKAFHQVASDSLGL